MKTYFLLAAAAGVSLTGCGGKSGGDWSNDCETYYSVTGRELSKCTAKVEAQRRKSIESGVSIDPGNMNREGHSEIGKGRSRHASEIPPEDK